MNNDKLINELKNDIPDLAGFIEVKVLERTAIVAGRLSTNDLEAKSKIEKLVSKHYPGVMFIYSVEIDNGLTVIADEKVETTDDSDDNLDEVKVVYMGELPVNAITFNSEFKMINNEYLTNIDNCFKVLGFISPIILDSNLKVIDGNLRLEIAKLNKKRKVPVVVINDSGKRADFLRMAINRSSEFQRWVYSEIDDFVDNHPQVQPLAEPLGFFGKLLLPTSFFANTVVNYRLDEYNEQQKKYRQEMGIAAWAELMRERNAAEIEAKKPRKEKKKNAISLFDLTPKKDDFLPVHDIEKDIQTHQEKMREVAETITKNYDEERKPQLMEQGKWQGTRRTSTEKALDLRKAAEEKGALLDVDSEQHEMISDEEPEVNNDSNVNDIKEEVVDITPKVKSEINPKSVKPKKTATKKKAPSKESQNSKRKSLSELIAEQETTQSDVFDIFAPNEDEKVKNIDDLF
jgi:hypothetical protein